MLLSVGRIIRKSAPSPGPHKAMWILPLQSMRDSRDGVIHVDSIMVLLFPCVEVGLLWVARSGEHLGPGLIYR